MLRKIAISILATSALACTPTWADMALATSKNCMACHALDKKLVGPSYKDVAAKYAGDKSAADKLAAKIDYGGDVDYRKATDHPVPSVFPGSAALTSES